ncbi:hypothetical protein V6N13_025565 [Hibiscus sabdariffa]|uniref:Transmembrane protein n=2 Tax=Hibiscus sabdariffa TaxID=183260 RepID=A0ABR2P8Q7_9ROSI
MRREIVKLGEPPWVLVELLAHGHMVLGKNIEMAQLCFSKAIMMFVVAVFLSVATTVSAQDSAAAPSPTMATGAALSLPVSGVAVTFSLIVSLVALLKQ